MAEYIEREALLEKIDDDAPLNWTDSDEEIQEQWDYRLYRSMVADAPTADVVEVRHGHWVWGEDRFRCSVCDSAIPKEKTDKKTFINEAYKYCRWCGAKMDGKDEKR